MFVIYWTKKNLCFYLTSTPRLIQITSMKTIGLILTSLMMMNATVISGRIQNNNERVNNNVIDNVNLLIEA